MIKLIKSVENAWLESVREIVRWPRSKGQVPKGISDQDFVETIIGHYREEMVAMWEVYTKNRSALSRRILSDRKNLATYMLGFHLPNAARFSVLIQRLETRHKSMGALRAFSGDVHVVDVGCGTGALSQTLCGDLSPALGKRLSFHLQDALEGAVKLAESGLKGMGHQGLIEIVKGRIEDRVLPQVLRSNKDGKEAWIFAFGYVWNELLQNSAAQQAMLSTFSALVAGGKPVLLLFVEPSNQGSAREQMVLRDTIVKQGFEALYPCPHQLACPMLERSRDWCYSEELWQVPRTQMKIDKFMGVNRKHLTSASYAFASPSWMTLFKDQNLDRSRDPVSVVVGKPLDEKKTPSREHRDGPGGLPHGSLLLCNPAGELTKRPLPPDQLQRMNRGYEVFEKPIASKSGPSHSKKKS